MGVAAALAATLTAGAFPGLAQAADTEVTIDQTRFLVNGSVTNAGSAAEGLLLNSRMIQAIFDDENPSTVGRWAYPDTGVWDPERNTDEFIAALPSYAAKGLRAVTVGLQGGRPVVNSDPQASSQPWIVTAYNPDGSLKPAWLGRLARVLDAADANGIVVILDLFYRAQEQRLTNEAAVIQAVDNVVDWLVAEEYANVLVEIGNETSNNTSWFHPILRTSRVAELINRVHTRSEGRLPASTSFPGGVVPPDSIITASRFVVMHGNNQTATQVRSMISQVKARSVYQSAPKPIVFNEDSTNIANLNAAVESGASWGYYEKGLNNYQDGFQAPPVNWSINTTTKTAFFNRAEELTTTDLAFTPASVALTATKDGDPVSETTSLSTGDGDSADYALTESSPWLSVDPDSGSAPETITLTADPSGLDAGTYSATVTATASGYTPTTLNVTLTVASLLSFEPKTLSFSVGSGAGPSSKSLELGTSGSTVSYTVADDVSWLAVSPSSGSAPATLTATADPSGLAPGTYSGTITATATGGEEATATVTLVVADALGSWAAKAQVPVSIVDPAAAAVDGKLYLVGGRTSSGRRRSLYAYDPVANTWATRASLPSAYPAVESPAAVAHDGKLYVFGGQSESFGGAKKSAAVYRPSTNSWTMLASMPSGRGSATAHVLGSKIYVVGGMDGNGASLATVGVYDPATNKWSTAASMSTRRDSAAGAVLDAKLYVFGGRTRNANGTTVNGMLSSVEAYDPGTNAWSAKTAMPTGRRASVAGAVNGRAQVIGGERTSSGGAFAVNEEYDPVTNSWRPLTALPGPRKGAAAATTAGIVYVVGGGTTGGTSYSNKNEAFAF